MTAKANRLLLLAWIGLWSHLFAAPPAKLTWREALIQEGVSQLENLIWSNLENERLGKQHENRYVIDLGNRSSQGEFVEERGTDLAKYRILSGDQLQNLNNQIKIFLSQSSNAKDLGFYAIVINDWKLRLVKKLPIDFSISALNDLKAYAMAEDRKSVDEMTRQLNSVPGEILKRLEAKGYTKKAYAYLYARLSTYDIDAAQTTDFNNPKVKRRVFLTQAFDGSPATKQSDAPKAQVYSLEALASFPNHYQRLQSTVNKFIESITLSGLAAERTREAEQFGIAEGPGRQLFVNLPTDKKLEASEMDKFVELCKHLNTRAQSKAFAFWHDAIAENSVRQQQGQSLHADVIAYLSANNLLSVETFNARFVERSSRDFETLWMQKENDLTAGIPANYNQKSKDYILGGFYKYSLRDLMSRNEQKKLNSIFWQYITSAELSTEAEPISQEDGVDQYVALYGTYSSLYYWMENFFIEVAEPASITAAIRTVAKFRMIRPIRKTDAQLAKELDVFKSKKELKKLEKAFESLSPEVKLKVTKLGNLEGIAVAGDEASNNIIVLAAKGNDELVEIGRVANGDIIPVTYLDEGTPLGESVDGLLLVKKGDDIGFKQLISKYPIEGFRDMALKWTGEKAYRFKKADIFYQNNKPADTYMSQIDDELRSIDFDRPVLDGIFKKDEFVYQWVYPKRGTIDEFTMDNVGSYFTKDPMAQPEKLGIPRDNRVLRKFRVLQDIEVLETFSSDVQWRGRDIIYSGGGKQFFRPNAKVNLEFVKD